MRGDKGRGKVRGGVRVGFGGGGGKEFSMGLHA